MSAFFDWLFEFLDAQIWQRIEQMFLWAFERASIFVYEQGAVAVEYIANYITTLIVDLDLNENITSVFSALPTDIQAYLSILNFPAVMAVLTAALGIRVVVMIVLRLLT